MTTLVTTPVRSSVHRWYAIAMACVVLAMITGCVKQSTYDAAQMEVADLKASLSREKDNVTQLATQAASLKQENQQQEQMMTDLVARLKKEQEADALWHQQTRQRTDALVSRLNAIQSQQRWLARETNALVKEQENLEALVAKYKGQLQDSAVAPERVIAPAPRDLDQMIAGQSPTSPTPTSAPPTTLSPAPAPSPPPLPQDAPPAPVPSKPEPQDDSWLSTFKGWIGSLWKMIFS